MTYWKSVLVRGARGSRAWRLAVDAKTLASTGPPIVKQSRTYFSAR